MRTTTLVFPFVLPVLHLSSQQHMPATGCTRCSLTFTGPHVSPPMVSLSAPNPWAGCRRHGHSPHGWRRRVRPGWETVTCPRADSQQRADLGSEPRQIPELNAVLALNAAAGGAARTLHRAASAHLPFLVCSLPSMSRQDPRPPGSDSHLPPLTTPHGTTPFTRAPQIGSRPVPTTGGAGPTTSKTQTQD